MNPRTHMLELRGARLHCEVRGTGPMVLMIPGGNGDAGPFERVGDPLADRYTVVTYDRRGFSRSPVDAPPSDRSRLVTDADDAHHLIDRFGTAPAYAFGSSSGAIVGLDLVARYPQSVRLLVAHEPPFMTLCPETEHFLAFADAIYELYRQSGPDVAMHKFASEIGLPGLDRPRIEHLPPALGQMLSRIRGNDAYWLEHELRQYIRVEPDLVALQKAANRIVLAGGHDSHGFPPYLPNTFLARKLGRAIVDFPGGHVGYVTHPGAFAVKLAEVLGAFDAAA